MALTTLGDLIDRLERQPAAPAVIAHRRAAPRPGPRANSPAARARLPPAFARAASQAGRDRRAAGPEPARMGAGAAGDRARRRDRFAAQRADHRLGARANPAPQRLPADLHHQAVRPGPRGPGRRPPGRPRDRPARRRRRGGRSAPAAPRGPPRPGPSRPPRSGPGPREAARGAARPQAREPCPVRCREPASPPAVPSTGGSCCATMRPPCPSSSPISCRPGLHLRHHRHAQRRAAQPRQSHAPTSTRCCKRAPRGARRPGAAAAAVAPCLPADRRPPDRRSRPAPRWSCRAGSAGPRSAMRSPIAAARSWSACRGSTRPC